MSGRAGRATVRLAVAAGQAIAGLIGILVAFVVVAAMQLVIGTIRVIGWIACGLLGFATLVCMIWGLFSLLVGWFGLHDRHALSAAEMCFVWAVGAYASIMLLFHIGQTAADQFGNFLQWLCAPWRPRIRVPLDALHIPDASFEE